jgi:hypothetical protein
MHMIETDPRQLTLHELRALRTELQARDDVISYVRRLAQARIDLVDGELGRRAGSTSAADASELSHLLGHHLSGGPARPPRPAADASSDPLSLEFEDLCARLGIDAIEELDPPALQRLRDEMSEFEHARSQERRDLFGRIDALSAELVRRYRDGEADIDGLLAED